MASSHPPVAPLSTIAGHILSAEVWDRRKLVLIARPPIEGAPFLFTIELSEKASVLLNDIRYPMQLIDADHKVISSALFPDDFIRSPPASILLDRFPPAWSALQAAASPSSRLIFPITEHHTPPPVGETRCGYCWRMWQESVQESYPPDSVTATFKDGP